MSNGYLISDYFENAPGAVVYAWKSSRFGSVPAQGDAPPGGSPDGGPITVGSTFGGPGAFQLHVPDVEDYYVQAVYNGVNYWKLVAAGALAFSPPLVGQVLLLSYWDGSEQSTPFDVQCYGVPAGWSGTGNLGAELVIGSGGIPSGVLLGAASEAIPDGYSFPASIFVDSGVITGIVAISAWQGCDDENVGGILVWGDTGGTPNQLQLPGGINTVGTINAGAVVTNGFQVNGVNIFTYGGNPTGVVASITEGDLVFDTGTPAIWQATAAVSSTNWVQIGGGGGGSVSLTINSGPVVDSGLLPLQITKQPLVPVSGILQSLPPLIGFKFPGTPISYPIDSFVPGAICAGPDGNLWVTDINSGVWKITTAGIATSIPLAGAEARGICVGPDGNLWVADGSGFIWQVTPEGATTAFALGGAQPFRVCAGPDGNLWVTDRNGFVWQVTTEGSATAFSLPGASFPWAICAGPDGNLWATDFGGAQVFVITTAGEVSSFSGGSGSCICSGPDGNLWMGDYAGQQVFRITPSGEFTAFSLSGASPEGICVGGGGDLWLTGNLTATFLKVTTAGAVTSFALGGGAIPYGICSGPDGNLWIADQSGNLIVEPFTLQMGQLTLTALPIVDPAVVGELWNNAGVVNVSAG